MLAEPATIDLPILYSFRRCPYAMRARLAIRASGISVVLREIVLRDKPAELIEVSPKATVPVLLRPDATVLEQSLDIMRWALARDDPHGWLRVDETDDVQALIDLNDGAFKQLLDRYKYASRHPERSAADYRDEAIALMLSPLNDRLARHRHLLRNTASLADMAIVPFVRQFASVNSGWFASAPLPHLQAWLAEITSSPLFDSVMAKFAPWRPGDEPVVF